MPSPPETLSSENSRVGPSIRKSLPASPNTLSKPLPPTTIWYPDPKKDLVASAPHPSRGICNNILARPAHQGVSAIQGVEIVVATFTQEVIVPPLVPLKVSGPSVPILFTAECNPTCHQHRQSHGCQQHYGALS